MRLSRLFPVEIRTAVTSGVLSMTDDELDSQVDSELLDLFLPWNWVFQKSSPVFLCGRLPDCLIWSRFVH